MTLQSTVQPGGDKQGRLHPVQELADRCGSLPASACDSAISKQVFDMTGTATRLLITIAFAAGATAATAQIANSGPAGPVPGSGDSTKISQGNRDNNAAYNQLVGAADKNSPKKDERPQARSAPVAATAADIKAGASLRDVKGTPIGTIVSVDATQAVVDTGKTKIGVPLIAFGKDDQGLLLGMTSDKFNELIAKAQGSR